MTQPRLPKKSNRHWSAKFADAFRGLKFGWTESSFLVHIVFAIAVIVCGFVFRVSQSEWLIVLLCIGVVMSAEMFNTAIESLARAVDQNQNPDIGRALDIASAAVLVVAICSAIIGVVVFLPHLLAFLGR